MRSTASNALHLRHGNVHQDDVGLGAVILRDGRQPVARFAGDFSAEQLHHLDNVFAREDGVVHYEIADGLAVFS